MAHTLPINPPNPTLLRQNPLHRLRLHQIPQITENRHKPFALKRYALNLHRRMRLKVLQLLIDRDIGLAGVVDGVDVLRGGVGLHMAMASGRNSSSWARVPSASASSSCSNTDSRSDSDSGTWGVEWGDRGSLLDCPLFGWPVGVGEEVDEEVEQSDDDSVVLDEMGSHRRDGE